MAEPKHTTHTILAQFREEASSNRGFGNVATDIAAEEFTRETELRMVA
jgi:hypothetical protein